MPPPVVVVGGPKVLVPGRILSASSVGSTKVNDSVPKDAAAFVAVALLVAWMKQRGLVVVEAPR